MLLNIYFIQNFVLTVRSTSKRHLGIKLTRSAFHTAAAAINQYLLLYPTSSASQPATTAAVDQQERWMDGQIGRTDGHSTAL